VGQGLRFGSVLRLVRLELALLQPA